MLNDNHQRIAVIGAGPAGISAAVAAAALGIEVDWYDKENGAGGKLNNYHQLFPGRESAASILEDFIGTTGTNPVKKHFGIEIARIEKDNQQFSLFSGTEQVGVADSVIIANGFDFFDARIKEEFGYGIYKRVVTSPDLERILKNNSQDLRIDGADPSSIAFVHCVGSRDQQVGINYCSRLCCITGIKQAIEIRELFPQCKVVNFYIDIRAFGTGYEELYREAQEKHKVRFIRGRVSEASENQQNKILLKAEDTLMSRPLKLTVDWLVLLVGMVPACSQIQVDNHQVTDLDTGFFQMAKTFSGSRLAGQAGVFTAGACCGPMSIPEASASGRSAAMEAWQYLKNR